MQVPFNNLEAITKRIKEPYLKKVGNLLDKGHFILSEEVQEFEKKWASYIGTKYAVGVSSGADALYLALVVAGIKPGDEVITQGNAYNASVTAILRVGAIPRFCDINPLTFQIDNNKIESLINSKTKAILPVHLYGQPGNIEGLCGIAEKHGLIVIEDCAQAHGAEFNGKKLGNFGLLSAFSFYPTKNLGALGDAGAVMTNNEKFYKELLARRNLGQTEKNKHQFFGVNMRMDPIQAVVLSLKLDFLDEVNSSRRKSAEFYSEAIKSKNLPVDIVEIEPEATSVYHLYVVKLRNKNREEVKMKLVELSIETAVHYTAPVYRQPFYQGQIDPCPITNDLSNRVLSLPLYYGITQEQQEYVIEKLQEILN